MTCMGAFTSQIRSRNEHLKINPPVSNIAGYVTGGLKRLYQQIESNSVPRRHDYGYYTTENGHFKLPKGSCVLALRYKVTSILRAKSQLAVLLMAEDLFNNQKKVVLKVLHVQFYELGIQESHCLWGLRVADPYNYSHTLRLLATFTLDGHYSMVFEPLLPDPLTSIFQEIPQHFRLSSIRKVALRLLSSVGFLHQQNLIHADLKPENILLKDRSDLDSVHIVDFGNALNYVHQEVSLYYSDFELQTPLYRAPEVMFGLPFGTEIDMWSIGCILAELYMGKPLFLGNRKEDILLEMTRLLGPLPSHIFQRGKFFPRFKEYTGLSNQCQVEDILRNHLHCRDLGFVNFLARLLCYDPDVRLTVSEAARHPFLAEAFPVVYLFPQSHDKPAGYSAVFLNSAMYQSSPTVSADIKKCRYSSIELLKLGTSSSHDHPWMALVDLIEKPTAHEKGRLAQLNSLVSSQDQCSKNQSQSSKCDMISSISSSSHCLERISLNSSGILVSDGSTIEDRQLVNVLGNSSCPEKGVIEDDLIWPTEQKHTDHCRDSMCEEKQLNQTFKGKQSQLERNLYHNIDKSSVFRESVMTVAVQNDVFDRPRSRADASKFDRKPVFCRLDCEMDTASSRHVISKDEYEKEEIISGDVDIDRRSFHQKSVSKTGRKQRRPVSHICKSKTRVLNHKRLNPNQNSGSREILQRQDQRRIVPVSQATFVFVKHESNEQENRSQLINADKSQICIGSSKDDTSKDGKSLGNFAIDLHNNPSVQLSDKDIVYDPGKIAGPVNETFCLKEKVNLCKSKQRMITPSIQEIFCSQSMPDNFRDNIDKFSNGIPYKKVRNNNIDNKLEKIGILSPQHSIRNVSRHKELVLKRSHNCDEDMNHIDDKRTKTENKSRALKHSVKHSMSSSVSSALSKSTDKEKMERRAVFLRDEVPPDLHKSDCQSFSVPSHDHHQCLSWDKSLSTNDSHHNSVFDDTMRHKLDSGGKQFSGTMSFGDKKFEMSCLQYSKDNEIYLNSNNLERSFITFDSRNTSLTKAQCAKSIRTYSDKNILEKSHNNEKTCNHGTSDWSHQVAEHQPTCRTSSMKEKTYSCLDEPEWTISNDKAESSDESFLDCPHCVSQKTSELKLNSGKTETIAEKEVNYEKAIQRSSLEKDAKRVIQRSSFENNPDINDSSPTGSVNLLQQGKAKKNLIGVRDQIQVQKRKAEKKNSVIHDPYYFHGSEEKMKGNCIADQHNSERLCKLARLRTCSEKGSSCRIFTHVNDCKKFSRTSKRKLTYNNDNPLKSAGMSKRDILRKKHSSGRTFLFETDVKNDNSNNVKLSSEMLEWNNSKKKSCPRDNSLNKIKFSTENGRRRNSTKSDMKCTKRYGRLAFIQQQRQPEFSNNVKARRALDETYTFISQAPSELHADFILSDGDLEVQSDDSYRSGFNVHRNSISQEGDYSTGFEEQSTHSQKSTFSNEDEDEDEEVMLL